MGKAFIRLGDRTSHGGTVISADMTLNFDGKCAARVGDLTVCPRCKGLFPIRSGLDHSTAMGQALAVEGDVTACGARLLASQAVSTADRVSGAGSAADDVSDDLAGGRDARGAVAAEAPTICLECLAEAAVAGSATVVRE